MRWLVLLWFMAIPGVWAAAAELSLVGYQQPDGAITLRLHGNEVDPYFAAKALLSARDLRIDTRQAATAWIRWVLPFQRQDGGFDRFCKQGEHFLPCAAADADDATAAVWIELLVKFAPPSGLPPEWRDSIIKADRLLSMLRDRDSGVYNISKSVPVSLLMDNIEVYSALKTMYDFYVHSGDARQARNLAFRAEELAKKIMRTFWDPAVGFSVSTQSHRDHGFYPDQVAQLFPILASFRFTSTSSSSIYALWMKENREVWLRQSETDFPWGLIALVADKMGDREAVLCWCARAAPFRHGVHWNVLEEAIYLAFESRFRLDKVPPMCGL